MTADALMSWLGVVVVLAPSLLVTAFCGAALFSRGVSERSSSRLTQVCVITGLAAALGVLALMLTTGERQVVVEAGDWAVLGSHQSSAAYHFHFKFIFDRLSVPFVLLIFVLVGVVGAFVNRYLHREKGYTRFFALYALFLAGMVAAALAGTVETLFLGWELVGLSSALLVAYFHERPAPVKNGQRVWAVYRVSDAAFLIAAIALHHVRGAGDFTLLMGQGPWPGGQAALSSGAAFVIGLLLLIAAAGKSGLVPFSGWLPRAMEGPTPSSAVFYGALSVHLGVYLLLRVSPILNISLALNVLVICLGLASAIYGALAARVQSDVKSALAFASLTQVGLMTAEIGFGWNYFALAHMIGHASLRTLQLLRAPNLLHDHHALENAIGGHLAHGASAGRGEGAFGVRAFGNHPRLYQWALARGDLDALIDAYVVDPFVRFFRAWQAIEDRCAQLMQGERASGEGSRDVDPPQEAA